jgi:hypothetical protein
LEYRFYHLHKRLVHQLFPERLVAVNKPQFAEDRKNQAFFHALNTAHGFCGRIEVYCLSSISPILENRGIQQ